MDDRSGVVEFPPWPHPGPEEADAASKVLLSGKINYWTGQEGKLFEKEFAQKIGVPHAVAVSNGTVALELALRVLGVGPGDEVVVTPRTFIASASAIVLCGAKPVFVDVDCDSGNITAETIEPALTQRTKAIVAVHLAGWPCEMDPILELARSWGVKVIEDCAQAHGATYKGRHVGSLGDAAAWSFCQDKIMTTGGEGGMLTTNSREVWENAWAYKDHGKSYRLVYETEHPPGFRWLHEGFGTNWRMTEMQSAVGRIALRKLDSWVEKRRRYASFFNEAFKKVPPLRVVEPPEHVEHAYYKYYVYVKKEELGRGWSRDKIMATLNSKGIPCFSGSCSEVYLEKAFENAGLQPPSRLPVAKEMGETSLMLLVHPTLDQEHIEVVADAVCEVAGMATR